jgi:hypothetical protein
VLVRKQGHAQGTRLEGRVVLGGPQGVVEADRVREVVTESHVTFLGR